MCDVGLAHHPKHIGLLHIKAKLAQTQECYEGALEGLRKAMQAVREEEDRWEEREGGEDGGMDVRSADDGFLREMAAGGGGGMEGGKKKTRRITTLDNSFDISGEPLLSFKFLSKKERGFELLDLEREVEGGVRRKVDFWVDATEVFLACGDVEGAGVCVKEAQKACPFSADGLACAARVRQVGGKVEGGEVRGMFDRVLRIDEGHVKGKIWLAELCRSNGEVSLYIYIYISSFFWGGVITYYFLFDSISYQIPNILSPPPAPPCRKPPHCCCQKRPHRPSSLVSPRGLIHGQGAG